MPKIIVEIEWDVPDELFWLNADNVAIALHAYCKNTKFKVRDVKDLNTPEAEFSFAGESTAQPYSPVI